MNNRKALVATISFVASLIAIFTFVTGIQNLSELGGGNNVSNIPTVNESINDGVIVDDRFATSTVYYVINGMKTKLFDSAFSGGFKEIAVSPDKERVVAIQDSVIYVANTDGSNSRLFQLYLGVIGTASNREYKNLSFTTSDTIRLYLGVDDFLTLENFHLNGPGTYEIKFDEFNYLDSVRLYR